MKRTCAVQGYVVEYVCSAAYLCSVVKGVQRETGLIIDSWVERPVFTPVLANLANSLCSSPGNANLQHTPRGVDWEQSR